MSASISQKLSTILSINHSAVSPDEVPPISPVSDTDSNCSSRSSSEDSASRASSESRTSLEDQDCDMSHDNARQEMKTITVSEEEYAIFLQFLQIQGRTHQSRANGLRVLDARPSNETCLQSYRHDQCPQLDDETDEGFVHEIRGPSIFSHASDFQITGGNFGAIGGDQNIHFVERDAEYNPANDDTESNHTDLEENSPNVQELSLRENLGEPPSYNSSYRSAQMHSHTQWSEQQAYKITGPTVLACARSFQFSGGYISPGAFCAVGGDQNIYA